jgi:uncharacterized membrane protein YhaH (DUF805 family)
LAVIKKQTMKKYFYSNDNQKNGPYTFEELKNENIKKETLIWYEGLEDWTQASELVEMTSILELNPPELNQSFIENNISNIPIIEAKNSKKSENIQKSKQGMFSKPFSFDGRIRRTEFGVSLIIYFIVYLFVLAIVESGDVPIIGLAFIPMLWFLWAQGAKRCHDIGNSGWYQIIPFYVFWMLFANGQKETNQYGMNPKL